MRERKGEVGGDRADREFADKCEREFAGKAASRFPRRRISNIFGLKSVSKNGVKFAEKKRNSDFLVHLIYRYLEYFCFFKKRKQNSDSFYGVHKAVNGNPPTPPDCD